MAKLFGSLICLSGALLLALYKGPPLTTSYRSSSPHLSTPSTYQSHSNNEWVKGILLVMLSNSAWSLWLILQVWSLIMNVNSFSHWNLVIHLVLRYLFLPWWLKQGKIVQQYPAKGHLTALQCFFSCIQTAPLAAIFDRNPSSWRLRWDTNLLAVVYCVSFSCKNPLGFMNFIMCFSKRMLATLNSRCM